MILTKFHRRLTVRNQTQRVVVRPGELYRVMSGYRQLRVLTGRAWITQSGKDVLLAPGQLITLTPDRAGALISALQGRAVTLELRQISGQ